MDPNAPSDTPLARIAEFWNWLPAFRAVAETNHLPSAAKLLGLSAPALSRAVRLLEQNVGAELFWRDGKGMQLTEAGDQFASALRDGMRRIHDGFSASCNETMSGLVRVSSEGAITTIAVTPALLELRSAHPSLDLSVMSLDTSTLPSALLAGELDIAFHGGGGPIHGPGIECHPIGQMTRSVYCSSDHPLAQRDPESPIPLEDVAQHDFVAPPRAAAGGSSELNDGWPAHIDRSIALEVDQLRVGLEACTADGGLLAILPDALAMAAAKSGSALTRLTVTPEIAPERVFAATRSQLGPASRAQFVREAVQKRL